jgi:hypothetical protein
MKPGGRAALGLLTAGAMVQWGAAIVGGALYPGYDPSRQYISELGAAGAATGWAVSWLGFVPAGLLTMAGFLVAAWLLRSRAAAVAGCLLLAWYGASLTGAGVFPCAFECGRAEPSFNALMHDLVGGTGYLAAPFGIWLVAMATRGSAAPWLARLGLVCGAVAAVGFVGVIIDPELGGVVQRVLEGAITLFQLALGWALARGRLAPAAIR